MPSVNLFQVACRVIVSREGIIAKAGFAILTPSSVGPSLETDIA